MQTATMLDLYCGAGGAARGYVDAGFQIVGVDSRPQPNYPYRFIQCDALAFVASHWRDFDLFHASPPCQAYSRATMQHAGRAATHPDLLAPTRDALAATGKPYVIENVVGAPMLTPIMLCGAMFPGLRVYRHRLFESNIPLQSPPHPRHVVPCPRRNVYRDGCFMVVAGHFSPLARGLECMGIDWRMSQRETANAIPPAYTRHIGAQLLDFLYGRLVTRQARLFA